MALDHNRCGGCRTGTETSTYDALGNLVKRLYSQGGTAVVHIEQAFDPLNRVTSLKLYSSDMPGQLVDSTSYAYDDFDRIVNLHHVTSTSVNIANYTYTFDAAGNVQNEVRNGTTTTYTYRSFAATKGESGKGQCLAMAV